MWEYTGLNSWDLWLSQHGVRHEKIDPTPFKRHVYLWVQYDSATRQKPIRSLSYVRSKLGVAQHSEYYV